MSIFCDICIDIERSPKAGRHPRGSLLAKGKIRDGRALKSCFGLENTMAALSIPEITTLIRDGVE